MFLRDLSKKEKELRKVILKASYEAKACHLGSALSCLPTLVRLHYHDLCDNDIFLFSKASGVAAYYAILADKGHFPKEKIPEYLHSYPLPSREVPGVIFSCGSLGHGLPVAAGIAYANPEKRVFVLVSDGECQEGTAYETALFARQHKLKNLYVYIDYNGIQACGRTREILDLETSMRFFYETFPHVKILYTQKGHGVDFMEDKICWHYENLTKELLEDALSQC